MDTKKELPHFYIGESLGGQQKWYSRITDFGMNVGGCAAVSACDCAIYFAKYFGLRGLYPFDLENISREDYLRFGKIREPYLYPRWSGENNFDDTQKIICRQIDAGYPLPCLLLKHHVAELKAYVWHWFILNGYEIRGGNFFVKAVSYGIGRWINFATLWGTGYERKGGLILFEI